MEKINNFNTSLMFKIDGIGLTSHHPILYLCLICFQLALPNLA